MQPGGLSEAGGKTDLCDFSSVNLYPGHVGARDAGGGGATARPDQPEGLLHAMRQDGDQIKQVYLYYRNLYSNRIR